MRSRQLGILGVVLAMSVTACATPLADQRSINTGNPAVTVSREESDVTKVAPLSKDEETKLDEMQNDSMTEDEVVQKLPQKISQQDAEKMLIKIDQDKVVEQPADDSAVTSEEPATVSSEEPSAYTTQQRWGMRGRPFFRSRFFGHRFFNNRFLFSSLGFPGALSYYPIGANYYPYYLYNNAYYPYYIPYANYNVYPYLTYTGSIYRPYLFSSRRFLFRHRWLR